MNIYFCGAIGGGRQKQSAYKELIGFCKEHARVYNQCVGKKTVRVHKSLDIYSRNMDWVDKCDILIAEVSIPSLGVGMEIEHAIHLVPNIPILCLYDINDCRGKDKKELSKMITNCPKITLHKYSDLEEAKRIIYDFLEAHDLLDDSGDIHYDDESEWYEHTEIPAAVTVK